MPPIPITIVTGFLGSGKTTLLLSLLPQLQARAPDYRLALLKNEFGDVAVDSQLAAAASPIAAVRELLNGCICCNLVGSLGDALAELAGGGVVVSASDADSLPTTTATTASAPDRIVIETSGSAFPATLAMEVNRLARATGGRYALDGVVHVVDVENWQGYADTSYTARLQARYTDLIVLNKWEAAGPHRLDACRDRIGDLDLELPTPCVRSDRGAVDVDLVFGVDGALARGLHLLGETTPDDPPAHDHPHHHHEDDHQSEVEVLSITLTGPAPALIDAASLLPLLQSAPKDEVYRIKAIFRAATPLPASSDDDDRPIPDGQSATTTPTRSILNWAFGRWTCTPMSADAHADPESPTTALRMTMILARDESTKWKKRIEERGYITLAGAGPANLTVQKIVT